MKPRHTAVVTLVGWYLIAPPLTGSSGIATQAPPTQWTVIGSYPSEEQCRQAKHNMLRGPTHPNNLDDQHLLAIQESECVEKPREEKNEPAQ